MFPTPYYIDATLKRLFKIDGGINSASPEQVEQAKKLLIDNKTRFNFVYNQTDDVNAAIDDISSAMEFPSDSILDETLKIWNNIPDGIKSADPDTIDFTRKWLTDNKDTFLSVYNKTHSVKDAIDEILNIEENGAMQAEKAMNESVDTKATKALLEFNQKINGLKDAYPEELPLVELLQRQLNKSIITISDRNKQAIRQFPMQFTYPVPTSHGEWTTQLHLWADAQVEDLLAIDPLMLTAKNSIGETVLMTLVVAATGKFTQQMNYDLIKQILHKNMNFVELTVPGDPSSKQEGCAWNEPDINGQTPIQYLIDFATGTGMFEGQEPDETLQQILTEFSQTTDPAPVDNTNVDKDFDETQAKQELIDSTEEINNTTETNPAKIKTPGEDTTTPQTHAVSESVAILSVLGHALV